MTHSAVLMILLAVEVDLIIGNTHCLNTNERFALVLARVGLLENGKHLDMIVRRLNERPKMTWRAQNRSATLYGA